MNRHPVQFSLVQFNPVTVKQPFYFYGG